MGDLVLNHKQKKIFFIFYTLVLICISFFVGYFEYSNTFVHPNSHSSMFYFLIRSIIVVGSFAICSEIIAHIYFWLENKDVTVWNVLFCSVCVFLIRMIIISLFHYSIDFSYAREVFVRDLLESLVLIPATAVGISVGVLITGKKKF